MNLEMSRDLNVHFFRSPQRIRQTKLLDYG